MINTYLCSGIIKHTHSKTMKALLPATAAALAVLSLCSCSGKKENTTTTDTDTAATVTGPSIVGKWNIENVVLNDSVYARPAEVTPGVEQYIIFNADSTYAVATNCNSIGGPYVVSGDTITIGDSFRTEMACDNMTVEDLLVQVLPDVKVIDFTNDSTLRLNSATDGRYIVLTKVSEADSAE